MITNDIASLGPPRGLILDSVYQDQVICKGFYKYRT